MACAESPGIFFTCQCKDRCSSRRQLCSSFRRAILARSEPHIRGRDAERRQAGGDRAAANDHSECRSASRRLEPAVPVCTANATCANCRTAAGPATATCNELFCLSDSVECRSNWVACRSASSRCSAATYAIHEARTCVEKSGLISVRQLVRLDRAEHAGRHRAAR